MKLWKSKAFWTAIVGIIVSFTTWATKEITFQQFLIGFFGSLVVIFVRDGIDAHLHEVFGKWKYWTSKTFWTIVAGIMTAVQQSLAGHIDFMGFIAAVLAALSVLFIRSAEEPENP